MWPESMRELAKRERPYGIAVTPNQQYAELGSPDYAKVTLARVQPIIESLGGVLMMEDYVLHEPRTLNYINVDWRLEPMDMDRVYDVPPSVDSRLKSLEAVGVVFQHWIWGEEVFRKPKVRVVQAPVEQRKLDPIIIGIVLTDPEREFGSWFCLGKWFH